MKKLAAALALGVTLAAGAAFADTMENSYGNTIVVTYANDAQARYQFNADGTFSATTPDGQTVVGTFTVDGDQLCLTPQGGEQGCTAVTPGKNVGDTWTQTGTDGSTITVTLQAGR
jgi:hypothetical protein